MLQNPSIFAANCPALTVVRQGSSPARRRLTIRGRARTPFVALALAAAVSGCGHQATSAAPPKGGTLVVALRNEPQTFNRYVAADANSELLSRLTTDRLVRWNRATGDVEPRLAQSWTTSPDGRVWTVRLRDDAVFSDGVPITASDVTFSFDALYDKRVGSPLADGIQVAGQPLTARALDPHTVVITCAKPAGPGIAMLDSLPILPRHALAAALAAGTFDKMWTTATPTGQLVASGPFVITEYMPGQHVRLARNPRFWKTDASGARLPYLDGIDLEIVPDQNAEVLRLESGDADLITEEARPEDLAALKQAASKGSVKLVDVGVSLDPATLWFNLVPGAPPAKGRPWLQRDELRQAISLAVDRQAIANTVYLGAATPVFGPVTPGYGAWYVADLPHPARSVAKATSLLASIGLETRGADGILRDAAGHPARFSILTLKGNLVRERTVAMLQEQLRAVGLDVDAVALDQGALIGRWLHHDYDAIYTGFQTDAIDPARSLDFWLSAGGSHFWNPNQTAPATDWERHIDALMTSQETMTDAAERRRLFAEAQRVFAAHEPAIYFVAPTVTVAMSARVGGVHASVVRPEVLWDAEALTVAPRGE